MSSRIAVVPGSFDPPTLGHLDVIRRAASLYDELHVLVVHNPGKEAMLPIAQRLALLEQSIAESDIDGDVIVASWSMGLLVDYATDVGAGVLVKGIRSQVDVAYETPMAIVNRHLAHVETVFLLPDPAHALVSSSLVRQVAALGGDVSPFVPPAVARFLDTGAREHLTQPTAPLGWPGSMDPREKPHGQDPSHQRPRHRAPPGRDARALARGPRPRRSGARAWWPSPRASRSSSTCGSSPCTRASSPPATSTPSTPASAARCLTDIAEGLQVEFQELFAYPGEEATDFEVQDDHVDLETLVRDAIVLSLPFQPVCQPDCPGLDPATGERRTESTGSEQREPLDPRWAALQDYTPDHDDEAPRASRSSSAENTEESKPWQVTPRSGRSPARTPVRVARSGRRRPSR